MQCIDAYPFKRKWPYVTFATSNELIMNHLISLHVSGYISNDKIWYCTKSKQIFVVLFEFNETHFMRDVEYFLVLEPSATTMKIESVYEFNGYIPQRYLHYFNLSRDLEQENLDDCEICTVSEDADSVSSFDNCSYLDIEYEIDDISDLDE